MQYVETQLSENVRLAGGYFVLRIGGCTHVSAARPGQFVMLRGDWGRDPLLPRAFSLLRMAAGGVAEILVKTVGRGSALFEHAPPGARMFVLGPLGVGFPAPQADKRDLLVAGGVGLAPLLFFAEQHRGAPIELIYGARSERDLVLLDDIVLSGAELRVATEDGSRGVKGLVTQALEERLDALAGGGAAVRLLCCGPSAMLDAVRAIARARKLDCLLSLEGEMACGIGACLGCAVATRSRPYRYVCKDGPVFDAGDLA
ncbi:MAG TPA: dihydroorotate dehydrogenase electron transfer subunit [Polyangia bacterium]|nr:dihydroorotate dehydrogenase electron transfer subunit [Polyangia bacterium]